MSEDDLDDGPILAVPPEVPMRLAEPDEIPKTAKSIAKLAAEHGWTVTTTYVKGTWLAGSHHERVKESIAVRMQRDGSAPLVAIWHDGKFHRGICPRPLARLNSTELRAKVKEQP